MRDNILGPGYGPDNQALPAVDPAVQSIIDRAKSRVDRSFAGMRNVGRTVFGVDPVSGKLIFNGYEADPNNADSIVGAAQRAQADMANGQMRYITPDTGYEPMSDARFNDLITAATVPNATIGDYAKGFAAPVVGGVGSLLTLAGLEGPGKALRNAEEAIQGSMTLQGQAATRPVISGNVLTGDVEVNPNANLSSVLMTAANISSMALPVGTALGAARLAGRAARAAGVGKEAAKRFATEVGGFAGAGTSAAMEGVPEAESIRARYANMTNEQIYNSEPAFKELVDSLVQATGASKANDKIFEEARNIYVDQQATYGGAGAALGGAIQFLGLRALGVGKKLLGASAAGKKMSEEAVALGKFNPERLIKGIKSPTLRRTTGAAYGAGIEGAAEASENVFSNTFQALGSGLPLTRERIGDGTAESAFAGAVLGVAAGGASASPSSTPSAPPPAGGDGTDTSPPSTTEEPGTTPPASTPPRQPSPGFPADADPYGQPAPGEALGGTKEDAVRGAVSGLTNIENRINEQITTLQQQRADLDGTLQEFLAAAAAAPDEEAQRLRDQIAEIRLKQKDIDNEINSLEKSKKKERANFIREVSKARGQSPKEVKKRVDEVLAAREEADAAINQARAQAPAVGVVVDKGRELISQVPSEAERYIAKELQPLLSKAEKELERARQKAATLAARVQAPQNPKRVAAARAVIAAEQKVKAIQQQIADVQSNIPNQVRDALVNLAQENNVSPQALIDRLTNEIAEINRVNKELEPLVSERKAARGDRQLAADAAEGAALAEQATDREAQQLAADAAQGAAQAEQAQAEQAQATNTQPEPAQDIKAQLEAAKETGKIVFADENSDQPRAPKGFNKVKSRFGGVYYIPTNGKAATKAMIVAKERDAQEAGASPEDINKARKEILGYTQTKEQALSNGAPAAVVAKKRDGSTASAELVDSTDKAAVAKAKSKAKEAANAVDGTVDVVPPATEQKDRLEKVKAASKKKAKKKASTKKKVPPKKKAPAKKEMAKTTSKERRPSEGRKTKKAKTAAKKGADDEKKKPEGAVAVSEAPVGVNNELLRAKLTKVAEFPIRLAPQSSTAQSVSEWLKNLMEGAALADSIGGHMDGYVSPKDANGVAIGKSYLQKLHDQAQNWGSMSESQREEFIARVSQTAKVVAGLRDVAVQTATSNAIAEQKEGNATPKFSKQVREARAASERVADKLRNGKYGRIVRFLEKSGKLVLKPFALADVEQDVGRGNAKFSAVDLQKLGDDNATLKTFATVFAKLKIGRENIISNEANTLEDAKEAARRYLKEFKRAGGEVWSLFDAVVPSKLRFDRFMRLPNGDIADINNPAEVVQLTFEGQELLRKATKGELPVYAVELAGKVNKLRADSLRTIVNLASSPSVTRNPLVSALIVQHSTKYSYDIGANYTIERTKLANNNVFVPKVLSETQYRRVAELVEAGETVRKAFEAAMREEAERLKENNSGVLSDGWERLPINDNIKDNQHIMKACEGTSWCTKDERSMPKYIGRGGSLYIFRKSGQPRLLVHVLENGTIAEGPNGLGPGQKVLPEDKADAEKFRREIAPKGDQIKAAIKNLVDNNVVDDILVEEGIVVPKFDYRMYVNHKGEVVETNNSRYVINNTTSKNWALRSLYSLDVLFVTLRNLDGALERVQETPEPTVNDDGTLSFDGTASIWFDSDAEREANDLIGSIREADRLVIHMTVTDGDSTAVSLKSLKKAGSVSLRVDSYGSNTSVSAYVSANSVESIDSLFLAGKRISDKPHNMFFDAPKLTSLNTMDIDGTINEAAVHLDSLVRSTVFNVESPVYLSARNLEYVGDLKSLAYKDKRSTLELPRLKKANISLQYTNLMSEEYTGMATGGGFLDSTVYTSYGSYIQMPGYVTTEQELANALEGIPQEDRDKPTTTVDARLDDGSIVTVKIGDGAASYEVTREDGSTEVVEVEPTVKFSKQEDSTPVAATVTDANGNTKILMDTNAVTEDNAEAVLLHEVFHAFVRGVIGEKAWSKLMDRLSNIYEQEKDGDGKSFFGRAYSRIPNDTNPDHIVEELGAYAVEEYERTRGEGMVASVVRWVKDFIAALRARLIRRGLVPKNITEADLAALSKLALKRAANGNTSPVINDDPSSEYGVVRYSSYTSNADEFSDGTEGYNSGPGGVVNSSMSFFNRIAKAATFMPRQLIGTIKDISTKSLRNILPFVTPHEMMDWVERTMGDSPQESRFNDAIKNFTLNLDLRTEMYNRYITKADALDTMFRNLSSEEADTWNKLVHDATVWKIHPDKAWDSKENRHNNANQFMKDKYDELSAMYEGLSPEAKTLYHETQRVQDELWSQIKEQAGVESETLGPFFHLSRHGDWVVEAERFFEISSDSEKGLKREKQRLYAQDPGRYTFPEDIVFDSETNTYRTLVRDRTLAFAETSFQAEQMKAQLEEEYGEGTVGVRSKKEYVSEGSTMSKEMYNKLVKDVIGLISDSGEQTAVMEAMTDVYLQLLPESMSARILSHRQTVAGANPDMWFAARQYFNTGSMLASAMKYKEPMREALNEMQESVDSMVKDKQPSDKYQMIQTELTKYMKQDANEKARKVGNRLTEMMFVMYMSSPSTWMVNMTQVPIFTFPYMSSLFNDPTQSIKDLGKAYSDVSGTVKKLIKREFDLVFKRKMSGEELERLSVKDFTLGSLKDAGAINAEEEAMLSELFDLSRISMSFARSTVRHMAPDPKTPIGRGYRTAVDVVSIMPHYTEVANRLVTALAVYRAARRNGQSEQQAVETAAIAVRKTQFDYANRPRAFKHPIAQIVLQFKIYSQHVINMWAEIFHDLGTNPVNSQEYKAAMRHLKYMAGTVVLSAGAVGLPLPMLGPLLIAAALLNGDDDDDLDTNGKVEMLMRNLFGDEAGKLMTYGPAFNLLGADMHARLAQNSLIFNTDYIHAENTRGTVLEMIAQLMGPSASYALSIADATDMIRQGNIERGFEAVMPKIVKDVMRAYRFNEEGITTRTGRELVPREKLSFIDKALVSIGIQPTDMATYQRERSRVYSVMDYYENTRKELMRLYYLADDKTSAWADIEAFNDNLPPGAKKLEITRATILRSEKARRKRDEQVRKSGGFDIQRGQEWVLKRALASPAY